MLNAWWTGGNRSFTITMRRSISCMEKRCLCRLDDTGSIWWIGHGQRLPCNDQGLLMPRAPILAERRQRLRDMRQGLDGLLDIRTHEDPRALRSIGPAP